ncbi:MAG: acylphosphatase [Nitrososphaeria archaeon]
MSKVRAHLFISGRVQGVFYRDSMRRKAIEYQVFGWVRNLPDGRVEAILEGDSSQVDKIIEWCKKGPPYAQVDRVESYIEPYRGVFHDFKILY